MLKRLVLSVLINTGVLVIIAVWIPQGGLQITPLSWSVTPVIVLMGAIFTLMYDIARPILRFLTTPINWITLGLAGIIINLVILYVFPFVVNSLGLGVTVQLGSIEQIFILSILITILTLVLKKIL